MTVAAFLKQHFPTTVVISVSSKTHNFHLVNEIVGAQDVVKLVRIVQSLSTKEVKYFNSFRAPKLLENGGQIYLEAQNVLPAPGKPTICKTSHSALVAGDFGPRILWSRFKWPMGIKFGMRVDRGPGNWPKFTRKS